MNNNKVNALYYDSNFDWLYFLHGHKSIVGLYQVWSCFHLLGLKMGLGFLSFLSYGVVKMPEHFSHVCPKWSQRPMVPWSQKPTVSKTHGPMVSKNHGPVVSKSHGPKLHWSRSHIFERPKVQLYLNSKDTYTPWSEILMVPKLHVPKVP